jgi:type I restriction enzyme S subunit
MDVLNLGILKELAIPLPELPEQEEIVRKVNEEFESIERQESAIRHALKQSSAQRKNLLKAAFSGQLVSQNPNDEPASHLLARIRAERASNDGSAPRRPRKIA